jgi:hypothetical protein
MKIIKRIAIWSATALVIQSLMIFMIDKYYEKTLMNTKVTEVRVYKDKKPQNKPIISIPLDAKKIEASFDGQYISYYEHNELNEINTYDGTKHIVNAEKNCQIVYSKWLPDINSMILCEKDLSQKRNINFFSYVADNNNKVAPTDTNNHTLKFTLNSSSDNIINIALSSTMGIMYIKVLKSDGKNDIFYNDVNGKTSSLFSMKNIGNISPFKLKPNLIYEDLNNNTVRITASNWRINNKQTCLFNTDNADNLYIGVLENEKVKKVLYGSIDKSIDKWTSLTFVEPENKNDVLVTKNGKVYVKNNMEGYIIDKATDKKVNYKGTLLKITDKTVISVFNGKLLEASLN